MMSANDRMIFDGLATRMVAWVMAWMAVFLFVSGCGQPAPSTVPQEESSATAAKQAAAEKAAAEKAAAEKAAVEKAAAEKAAAEKAGAEKAAAEKAAAKQAAAEKAAAEKAAAEKAAAKKAAAEKAAAEKAAAEKAAAEKAAAEKAAAEKAAAEKAAAEKAAAEKAAAKERSAEAKEAHTAGTTGTPPAKPGPSLSVKQAKQLYARHCAGCHGLRGDGKGIASQFLFPKPRDFRTGRFRLVSTANGVPSRDDLQAVLLRGMPGSAMPPWGHLSQAKRNALVGEVLRLRADGAKEQYVDMLKKDEDLSDEELAAADVQQEINEYVTKSTTPAATSDVPDIGSPTAEAIARGKLLYAKSGCLQCHGETGKGDGVQKMFDDKKLPTSPRDFTLGIFKGGHDPASLYRRIAYGMPGTPMPSSSSMTAKQMVDLVHYIRSLSSEQQRKAAVLNRERIVARAVDTIPGDVDAATWSEVPPVVLRTTPLWWRSDPHPFLTVQAVHDKKQIAVRLSWGDDQKDRHAARSEAFEDAVAMEWYRGTDAPFLGMGDAESPVDVWYWDADRQGKARTVEDIYPNMVVDRYPLSEAVAASASFDRAGARTADQPDVSLPARASGNQIVPTDDDSGGSTLTVGGPGSVTFRMPRSQLVRAHGTWKEGRWSVELIRTLAVASAGDGIALKPGDHMSVAFAVWNGAQQDRDGKKKITIWQELELEP